MIPRRRAHVYPGEFADIARWSRSEAAGDGTVVHEWERAVAEYVGMPEAVAVSSGRRGMTLILERLGIHSGDEVVVPAYTLKDLIPLIQGFGAKAVPADIDPETFNMTPATIERRLTERTKAILCLHVFGVPCEIESILALAARHGVPVIEDCAHALGASVGDRRVGSFGHAAFFSLEPTKPVNTFGGGVVVSRDAGLIDHVRAKTANDTFDLKPLRMKVRATRIERFLLSTGLGFPLLYLLASPRWKDRIGRFYRSAQPVPAGNLQYAPVQARLGLAELPGLQERMALRKERAALLRSLLRPEVRTQRVESGCQSAWYFFVAVLPGLAGPVRQRLLLHGIDAAVEDEVADNCAALLGYDDCPAVNEIFPRAIALPMYDGISESAIRRVARALNAALA